MQTMRVKIASQTIERKDTEVKALKPAGEYKSTNWRVLGVPFGGHVEGRDSDGEAFTSETQIGLKLGDTRPITYYHGFGVEAGEAHQDPPAILGEATYAGKDDRGHWFNIAFDESEPLARRVIEAGADAVKASSGAVSHLVRGTTAGIITNWPVGELALFDTNEWRQPANQLAVVELVSTPETTESEAEAGEALQLVGEGVKSEQLSQTIRELTEGSNMENEEEKLVEETIEQNTQETVSKAEFDSLKATIEKMEEFQIKSKPHVQVVEDHDSETKAMKSLLHYIRTGEKVKASNPVDMAEGAVATGGAAVPTGFYQKIIARRSESMLADKLGVLRIPGKGLTVQVPFDNEDDGEFVPTAEAANWDKDTPALGRHEMTLVKYTKDIPLSIELLRDEDARLEDFLADWIGRGMAKTHNSLLVSEILANGTNLNSAVGTPTAYTGGFAEKMVYAIPDYLEAGSTAWITSGPNYGLIAGLTGNQRLYNTDPQGNATGPSLMQYPVHFSTKVPAVAASAKSIIFGNFRFVGLREGHSLTILRDPYSQASKGQVVLHVHFDAVYKVLQPKAIGFGTHAAS